MGFLVRHPLMVVGIIWWWTRPAQYAIRASDRTRRRETSVATAAREPDTLSGKQAALWLAVDEARRDVATQVSPHAMRLVTRLNRLFR